MRRFWLEGRAVQLRTALPPRRDRRGGSAAHAKGSGAGVEGRGMRHGVGTVAKALADLTATGALVNPRVKRGYRLPGWIRPHPTLFGYGEAC